MLMSIFGIPLSGADICGFMQNTNEELCTKWHFVGAFYPFSRNHNGGQIAQEPYVWSATAQAHMRDAIKLKYSLVRYYYTSLFDISTRGEGTFYKPLFFEFPEDPQATLNISSNVMLGSALKLSINSDNTTRNYTDFYFPEGLWCRLSGNTSGENCFQAPAKGIVKNYTSGLADYQLHLREGYIVPMQNTSTKKFSTTKDLQGWPVEFHILGNPDVSGVWSAEGRYVNDDGLNLDLNGTVNSYDLLAYYDGISAITVKFTMDETATKGTVTPDGCYSVNRNDFVSAFTFHNAKAFGLNKDLQA